MQLFRIELKGLKAHGYHGVAEFERQYGQEFVVDVTLLVDAAAAADTDDITKTVHYGELADLVVADVKTNPVNLLETVAKRVCHKVAAFSPLIKGAEVTIHKPNAPIDQTFSDVAVSYAWGVDA